MTTRKSKVSARRKPSSKSGKNVSSQLAPPTPAKVAAAKKKFQQGILARGEAVEEGEPLTPGATHVIVGRSPDGTPILKRKRFSIS